MPAPRFVGVYAATTIPLREDGSLDIGCYQEHCSWLVDEGVSGIVPNGSLGEYETLTGAERESLAVAAVEAVGRRAVVVPGVSGRTAAEALQWAEHAAAIGAPAVMALPPTSHRPTEEEVVAHYAEIAKAGLPIIVYNNPFSTRVDLTPRLLHRITADVGEVVAVKEFSQDARRVWQIAELTPELEVICGCDDTLVEAMLAGAVGWIAGFVNAFPAQSVHLFRLCEAGQFSAAAALYRKMLPILRWDADPRFVQAIKLGQQEAGRYGGPVRLPRLPLPEDIAREVRAAARVALEAGY
jgi:1-pyrroline-4-hydroxy-2-carboxylate deaminase